MGEQVEAREANVPPIPVSGATVQPHGYNGQRSIPSFYETAATVNSTESEIAVIGRSLVNPFKFFLFSKESEGRPNGTFLATVDLTPVMDAVIAGWPEAKKLAEYWASGRENGEPHEAQQGDSA